MGHILEEIVRRAKWGLLALVGIALLGYLLAVFFPGPGTGIGYAAGLAIGAFGYRKLVGD